MSENLEAIVSVGSDISGIERAVAALAELNDALVSTADGGSGAFVKVARALQALPADFERIAAAAVGSFDSVTEVVTGLEGNLLRLQELSRSPLSLGGGLTNVQLEETLALLQRVAAAEAELRSVTGGPVTSRLAGTAEERAAATNARQQSWNDARDAKAASAAPEVVDMRRSVEDSAFVTQQYQRNLAELNDALERYVPAVVVGTATEEEVRAAAARLVAAEERYAASLEKGTLAQSASALSSKISAEANLNKVLDGAEGGGGGGGLLSGLGDFASVAKYLLLYQGFQLVVTGAKDAFDQTVALQRSVTSLGIATSGSSINVGAFADELGRIGTAAGLADSAAVDAATQFIRAFPNADPTTAGKAGANTAATLNVIGDPKTVVADTQSVVSILSSFNLTVADSSRVLDAATVSAQAFGLAGANAILPGVAQISDLAAASGFTVEQTTATVAAIINRTGESSDAAAGELRRFLGREGNSAFQKVFQDFGVNTRQNFEQELQQFAPIFQNLGQQQRAAVIGQLGGGRAGAAVEAILGDYARLQAVSNAPIGGAAAAQEQKRLGDLKGLLTSLGGDFKQLSVDVGKSGIADIFGLALEALNPLLQGVDAMLQAFDALPGPVRQTAIALAEVAAVLAVIGRESEGGLIGSIGAGAKGLVSGAKGLLGIDSAAGDLAAAGPEGAALAGTAGISASAAVLATGVGVAVVGLLAVGEWKNRADALSKALDDGKTAAATFAGARTADDFKAASSQFGTAANEVPTGFFADLFLGKKDTGAAQGSDKALAAQAAAEAVRLSKESADVAGVGGTSVFGVGANQDVAAGFAYLHTAGLSAGEDMRQLGLLLNGVAGAAGDANGRLTLTASTLVLLAGASGSAGVTKALNGIVPGTQTNVSFGKGGSFGSDTGGQTYLQQNPLLQQKVESGYLAGINDAAGKLPAGTALTPAILSALEAAGKARALALLPPGVQVSVGKALDAAFERNVASVTAGLSALQSGKGLSAAVAAQIAGSLDTFFKDTIAAINALKDPGQRAQNAQKLVQVSQELVAQARSSGNAAELVQAQSKLQDAQDAMVAIEVANAKLLIDHLKAYGGNNAKTKGEILAITRQVVLDAAASGNTDAVIAALDGLDKSSVASIISSVNQALAAAQQARAVALSVVQAAITAAQQAEGLLGVLAPGQTASFAPGTSTSGVAAINAQIATLIQQQATLNAAQKFVAPSGSDFTFPKAAGGSGAGAAKKAGELAAAIVEASAIPGDPVSQDTAAVKAAEAKIQDYKKGSTEWYGAIKALRDAQYQLATLYQQLNNDNQLLARDVTDPLVVAREKVAADLVKLQYDKGRHANTIADSLTLKQDQAAAEKTAFDQKFSDEQTAYQLNQISYSAYLNYLESQHNLLTSVKNKTRDQIDELNQVDQALQSAQAALAGQFNIGAISLPTIYEVRRSIQAAAGSGQSYPGGGGGTVNNTFTFSGTDIGAVKKVLEDVLGPTASATRTVAGRK